LRKAGVAQLAEQLICNQQVVGSTPITSSIFSRVLEIFLIGIEELYPALLHCRSFWWGSRVAKGIRL
jgi:hypothetical protein